MDDELCSLLRDIIGGELPANVASRIRDAGLNIGLLRHLDKSDLQTIGFEITACKKIMKWKDQVSPGNSDVPSPPMSKKSLEQIAPSSIRDTSDLPTPLPDGSHQFPATGPTWREHRARRQETATERRRLNSDKHAALFVRRVADLVLDRPEFEVESPDIRIKVKDQIFNCHKFVLHIASGYFRQVLSASPDEVPTNGDVIDLGEPDVSPSTFECVLRYIYLGTVEIDKRSVGDMLVAADALLMPDLRQLCIDYMLNTVGPDNCFDYWHNLESFNWSNDTERKLVDKCRSVARTTFWRSATNPRPLNGATDSIVEMLLRDSCLQVQSEQQVCQTLFKWLTCRWDQNKVDDAEPEVVRFLQCIRWSGVRAEYIKSYVVDHPVIRRSSEALRFVQQVLLYHTTGVQFDGLTTAHRPSTKSERSILTLVGGTEQTMAAVSAQYTGSVEPRLGGHPLPFDSANEAASVVVAGKWLFVVGTGDRSTDIWRFDIAAGWRRWAGKGLCFGRRRHCVAATTNMTVFVVGGYCPADRSLVSFVERLGATSMTRSCEMIDEPRAEMPFPVLSAACVAYGDTVYVFGGMDGRNEKVNHVQIFDTLKNTWAVLNFELPVHLGRLNAAVYEDSIVILGADLHLVHYPITGSWRVGGSRRHEHDDGTTGSHRCCGNRTVYGEKESHKGGTDVSDFGMAIDDGRLFVLGGRRFSHNSVSSPSCSSSLPSKPSLTWTPVDEVRSIDVKLVISGATIEPGQWSAHAKLPCSSLVSVCGVLTVPSV